MKPIYSGKVREIYDVSDRHLVIVTTDRISAFDSICVICSVISAPSLAATCSMLTFSSCPVSFFRAGVRIGCSSF